MIQHFVLSIQSDVVFGHVGLAAARPVFLAQGIGLFGLPTVLLSHHPGHSRPRGRMTPADELQALFDGLDGLGLLARVSAISTGYFADVSQIKTAAAMIARVRARNPQLAYWCDPVMGDEPGGLYVPKDVARGIVDHLIPLADVILPNGFEAGFITGIPVTDRASAVRAAAIMGVRQTIITSVPEGPARVGVIWQAGDQVAYASAPRRSGVTSGLGDCFAALSLALTLKDHAPQAVLDHGVAILGDLLALPRDPKLPPELPLQFARKILELEPR